MDNALFIIGGFFITMLLGVCIYFLQRLISSVDENFTELRKDMIDFRKELRFQSDRQHGVINRVQMIGAVVEQKTGFQMPEWDMPQRTHQ